MFKEQKPKKKRRGHSDFKKVLKPVHTPTVDRLAKYRTNS